MVRFVVGVLSRQREETVLARISPGRDRLRFGLFSKRREKDNFPGMRER